MIESTPGRIAIVAACPFPTSQGSQVFVCQLADALARAGHEVHVVTYGFGEFEPADDLPYRIHRVTPRVPSRKLRAGPSVWKPFLDGLLVALLLRVCRRHRIGLIHAVNYEAALVGYAVRRLTGLPVLYHSHGVLEQELPTYFHGPFARRAAAAAAGAIERLILRGADAVVALCDHDARHAKARVRRGVPVVRVNPGTDPAIRPEETGGRAACGEAPVFAYTGNLDRYQGLGIVLAAFRAVLRRLPEARLVFATGSEPGPLLAEARYLGVDRRVAVLAGADMPSALPVVRSACAALVPRSVPYGFPIKLLNYMAVGVPVIVCDNAYDGFVHEQNALICEPDAESYAAAMLRLASDPALRERIAEGAARLARERYAWGEAVERIRATYRAMAPEAAVPAQSVQPYSVDV